MITGICLRPPFAAEVLVADAVVVVVAVVSRSNCFVLDAFAFLAFVLVQVRCLIFAGLLMMDWS